MVIRDGVSFVNSVILKHLGLRNNNKKISFFLVKALRKGLVHLSGVTLPWE